MPQKRCPGGVFRTKPFFCICFLYTQSAPLEKEYHFLTATTLFFFEYSLYLCLKLMQRKMDNYIVSARKYRPSTFKDVVGQKNLTTTLKNAIQNHKLAHAYLFCGPRGVGKTSCARIFAKTINCLHPTETGEACNACESCQAFNEQRSYNIRELDAASNNSVDDIRSLTDEVRVPPAIGNYKVFIIDEVHMLSSQAFNAFLKTLEEPPRHAVFILATTEKHKVLPTILSRCQTYDFTRITVGDIVEHLQYVASQEGIQTEAEALNVIAQKADGGMRDALSIFDQVASFTNGNITYQAVIHDLNVLDYEYYFQLTEAILGRNVMKALLIFNEILNKGFDAQNFITGLATHFRDLLVCKNEETLVLFEVGASIREHYKSMAKQCPDTFLFKAIELANTCDLNYRTSRNKRLLVELTLIQLCQLQQSAEEAKKKVELRPVEAAAATQPTTTTAQSVSPSTASASSQGTVVVAPTPPTVQRHEITMPSPTPAVRKSPKAPMGTSLKSFTQSRQPSASAGTTATNATASTDMSTPYTEEELQTQWVAYAHKIEKNAYLQNIMLNNLPTKQENDFIEVGIHNPGMQEELFNNTVDILTFLRSQLKNSHIQLRVRMMKSNEKHLAYTPTEKYNHMLEINPLIAKLRDEFKLRLE